MPVVESVELYNIAPKSVIRHRPLSDGAETPTVPPWKTSTPRASRPPQGRAKTHTTESHAAGHPKLVVSKKVIPQQTKLFSLHQRLQSLHWMVLVGLTMIAMALLFIAISQVWSWGTDVYDNIHYGMPRTTQVDAFVGAESEKTPSHFIAENLRGRLLIIELPGGDAQHARIFVGPQLAGPQADTVPITLTFVDRHGSHYPDMEVQFGSLELWYVNEHGTFVLQ